SGPTAQTTKPATPAQTLDGEKLYKDNCAACHGGKGVGGSAKALTATNADRTKIENGNVEKGMPAFAGRLTPDEITAILEYLKS
ncbi:MAG: cytochrome c, partial [Candidatus Bathyarchaeia archaeon]